MKLESNKMGDESLSSHSEDAILSDIKSGKIYREAADYAYSFSGDVTDACIDASRYTGSLGIRLSLREEILSLLDSKDNIQERFKLAELDSQNVIAAYLASYPHYSLEDISNLLTSKDEYLRSIGVGLSVIYDNPQIIPSSNVEGLYKYFRSREIRADELKCFSSNEFVKHSFGRMLQEERVIFTWMINNLISLVEIDAVRVDENSEFFVSFLRDNDYPNETHKALFVLALRKHPSLIESILKIRLRIDPFTKQNNYSKWLVEVRKFKFISALRDSLPRNYISQEVALFDKTKSDVYRIYRHDKGLEF